MESIIELEKRVMQNRKKAAPKDLDILARHYWDLATRSDDFRDKRRHLKRSSFFAGLAFAAGVDAVEQLELHRTIFQRAIEFDATSDGERGTLSKIIARWLEKTGADKHEVLGKAKGWVPVEGGTICLGDRTRLVPWGELNGHDAQMVQWANGGERLSFATGGDGQYRTELRLIDAPEPVLTAQEYKKLTTSTQTVVIDVPSGTLQIAETACFVDGPWDKQKMDGTVCLKVPPGRYKACAFGFSTPRSESVIAVVTATSDEPRNDTKSLDQLFG